MLRPVRTTAAALALLAAACGQEREDPRSGPHPETAAPAAPEPETAAPTATTASPPAGPATAEPATSVPASGGPTKVATKRRRAPVVVYQAAWCTPCHTLSDHLRRRGVRHVNKDIETTAGAREEMDAKLARAGRAGAQLPVMDFRGRVVVGYDPATVDRLCDEDLAASGAAGGAAGGAASGG